MGGIADEKLEGQVGGHTEATPMRPALAFQLGAVVRFFAMGDWCIAEHFIVGPRAAPVPTWADPKSWAMRVGPIAPGLQLMQTMEKWSCQRLAGEGVLGMCSAHDYLAGGSNLGLVAGWNYLLDVSSDGDARLENVARDLDTEARVVSHGRQRALCIRETILFNRARWSTKLAAVVFLDDPLSKVAAAFARTARYRHVRDVSLTCGMWTPEHGFVHTGEVRFSSLGSSGGAVEWVATGRHNLLDAAWNGPCAGHISLQTHPQPVRVGAIRWPFQHR